MLSQGEPCTAVIPTFEDIIDSPDSISVAFFFEDCIFKSRLLLLLSFPPYLVYNIKNAVFLLLGILIALNADISII